MPKVTFLPKGSTADVPGGTLLLDAARSAGFDIDAPCGGSGTCGGCSLGLVEGSVALGGDRAYAGETVLACRAVIGDTAITVRLPDYGSLDSERVPSDESRHEIEAALDESPVTPLCRNTVISVPPPRPEDGLSDTDRLLRSIPDSRDGRRIDIPLSVMRRTAEVLRAREGKAAVSVFSGISGSRLTDIRPGGDDSTTFGIAVDLGTTTVAVRLVDLVNTAVIGTATGYNGQISCGADIIGRINYASTPERLEDLRLRAAGTINRLVDALCADSGVRRENILCGVLSGNTVMTHLILGLDPEYIRLEPYTPTVLAVPDLPSAELGIPLHREARIAFASAVGSYVGGDIVAGLLCTGIPDDPEGISLFIDAGTNGEIAAGNGDFIMACACSAGPAFEGGGLTCGMRATRGAIDRIAIDPVTGEPSIGVIGGGNPLGICGSAAIELLAGLFRHGWMDSRGKLNRDKNSPRIRADARRAVYDIAPPSVSLSEQDIQSVIRAKAAIYSAADLLLRKAGASFGDVDRFYIAGGFGRSLDIEAAVTIGLLPDIPRERFRYLGNASLKGSTLMLLSKKYRELHDALAGRITYVNLSNEPEYMDRYTAALFVPHTDFGRFPGVVSGA